MDFWTNPMTGQRLRVGDTVLDETLRSLPTALWYIAGMMPISPTRAERVDAYAATTPQIDLIRQSLSHAVQQGLVEPGNVSSVSERFLSFYFKVVQSGPIPINVGVTLAIQIAEDFSVDV